MSIAIDRNIRKVCIEDIHTVQRCVKDAHEHKKERSGNVSHSVEREREPCQYISFSRELFGSE
jgi:hypothetical protein